VIPDAVKIQTEFIPNIFTVASFDAVESIITFAEPIAVEISVNTRLKCYDMRNNTIIVVVAEIISQGLFKIRMNEENPLRGTRIFVYGTEVKDFHALNKEYINTLNVSAVQELHRKIVLQQGEINELKEKVNVLINYIDMSKITALEGEINEMKVRYDFIINYINLSK
jgi:FtsZ-binding cell division protein ZapB